MNWLQPIDLYCERTVHHLWAEPINSITNLAFIIGAMVAYRWYRQSKNHYPETILLIIILAMIGVGSFLFHVFGNTWSLYADIIPIALFQMVALWLFLHRSKGISKPITAACVILFIVVSQLSSIYIPDTFLNGSGGYLPSLLTMAILALLLRQKQPKAARLVSIAAVIFCCSLAFRSVDMMSCEIISFGTHFMWHILNAVTLTTIIRAAIIAPNHPKNNSPALT